RKTEEGQEAQQAGAPAEPPPRQPDPEPEPEPRAEFAEQPAAPRTPTPQERLRHAFSSDLPENMMSPPEPVRSSSAEYQWESVGADITRQPELRVVGVGGGGVNRSEERRVGKEC